MAWNLRVAQVTTHFIKRHTSKIAVEIDNNVLEKLENMEIKPRKHPGLSMKYKPELPAQISVALKRVVGDHPVKALLQDSYKLNRLIAARHPPTERHDLKMRMREIVEEVDMKLPKPAQFKNEQQQEEWRHKRDQNIQKIMAQRTYAWKPINYGPYEALVYAVGRGAQEYAVIANILREIVSRDSEFCPRSYFDFGSGVGTGMWAVSELWRDNIFEYFNVDSSRDMHDLSELILRDGNENQQTTLRNVYYRQFLPALETKYDLVMCAYTLFELTSSQQRQEVFLNLWKKCDNYLIFVEEGTRRGSELINEARDYILSLKTKDETLLGHVFAPVR